VVAAVTVSEQDLRTLLGIVNDDDRSDLPEVGLPWSLLADLMDQIHCDALAFFAMDSSRKAISFSQDVLPPDGRDGERAFWDHYWACDPCCYPDRGGDLRSVVKVSDFYSARQWHSTGMYCDLAHSWGLDHELLLFLPARPGPAAGPGQTVRLIFYREPGPDFSERDRSLLELLRPHLHQAYLDAQRRRSVMLELTLRQWELLRQVAAGHTNAQIARRLGVSEGTVRTHLQNIYGRLQVSSRTAAVTRAFPDLAAV
jgi:DNA-binding CsgD family transcriptional regulator